MDAWNGADPRVLDVAVDASMSTHARLAQGARNRHETDVESGTSGTKPARNAARAARAARRGSVGAMGGNILNIAIDA